MMTHEEIQADLALFALGSLDPDDRRSIEEHLVSGCSSCERELRGWSEVMACMPVAEQDVNAPNLKPQLLARVHSNRRSKQVVSLRRWWPVPLAAAAMALLAFGVVREMSVRSDDVAQSEQAAQSEQVARLRSALQTSETNLKELKGTVAKQQHNLASLRVALDWALETLAIVQTPGLHFVSLEEASDSPPANAHMLISGETGRGVFYAFDLPKAPQGDTYELWWLTEKAGPIGAGRFVPDRQGLGRVEVEMPEGVGEIRAAAVTIEPIGGIGQPTGSMVLIGLVTKGY